MFSLPLCYGHFRTVKSLAGRLERQDGSGYFFVFQQKNVRTPEGLDLARGQRQTPTFALVGMNQSEGLSSIKCLTLKMKYGV